MIDFGVSDPVMVSFSLWAAVVSSTGGAHKAAPHSVHSALHFDPELTRAVSRQHGLSPPRLLYGIR